MAGHPVAECAVESYLDAVAARLVGPRPMCAAILDELRDGLHESAANHRARGAAADAAVRSAVNEFGTPKVVAAAFAGELAASRARRTVAAFLITGPAVGLLWLPSFAPPRWWLNGPVALLAAVPVAPVVVAAVVIGVAVLAATGRPSRWLQPSPRTVLHGALLVVAATTLGDLVVIVIAVHEGAAATLSTIGVLAIAASTIRLGFSVLGAAGCLRSRRTLTA